jgi:flagellar basal-body rod modification protein FlgD
MSVEGISSAPPQQEFLTLLVAQLEHQNPLDPQDGAAFVAQLAQFASLEQAAETNQRLTALQAGQESAARASLTALVGHEVSAQVSELTIGDGAPPPLNVHLEAGAASVKVELLDAQGNVVRTVELGAHARGDVPVDWGAAGPPPAGTYQLRVTATAADGSAVGAEARIIGRIDSVEFVDGGSGAVVFHIGSAMVAPADIQSVEAKE